MPELLPYERVHPRSKMLSVAASVTLAYPLLVLSLLYAQWFVAWMILGHPPDPTFDIPETIRGLWCISQITRFAILGGTIPVALLALGLNVAHIAVNRPGVVRGVVRLAGMVLVLAAAIALIEWDPGEVVLWGV